jgi:hypothetical protein
MGIKVLVNSTGSNRVSINNQNRKTVRTIGISSQSQIDTLAELRDVDASDPDHNETLVYDSTLQKYVVKTLPVVDGGSY